MAIYINLISRPARLIKRTPKDNDGRWVFTRGPRPSTYWTLHKNVSKAIEDWFRSIGRTKITPKDLLSPDEASRLVNSFGDFIEKEVAANLKSYALSNEVNGPIDDCIAILKDRLPPRIFGNYIKVQLREVVRFNPRMITAQTIMNLFKAIEVTLGMVD